MTYENTNTLRDLISNAADEYGDREYIIEKDGDKTKSLSYKKLFENAGRICSFVDSKKTSDTLHAAVIGPTCSEYIECYFGTVIGKNVIVPIDAQLSPEDICSLLNRSDSEILFFDARFAPIIPLVRKSCERVKGFVSFTESEAADTYVEKITEEYPEADKCGISPDDLASIVYTSGTTGVSKGVMLTHGNLIDNVFCEDDEADTESAILSVLPIHHIYCLTCDVLLSLRYGARLCVNDSLMRIAKNLKLFSPTVILLVPMIAETILKQIKAASAARPEIPAALIAKDVFGGRLDVIYSGGAYLNPNVTREYRELGITILQGYGMTECSPRISSAIKGVGCDEDVGAVVKRCEVKTVDGEILVKSPSVMKGYYKDPASTAEALTPDGWLRTGDLGYVDENNCIFITGRKKNLIILSNGENVSPEELENKFSSVPFIQDVLVYSDDSVITAEFYPSKEALGTLSRDEIIAKIREAAEAVNNTVSTAKAIRRIRLRDAEFDKTTSKKIRREQPVHGEIV